MPIYMDFHDLPDGVTAAGYSRNASSGFKD